MKKGKLTLSTLWKTSTSVWRRYVKVLGVEKNVNSWLFKVTTFRIRRKCNTSSIISVGRGIFLLPKQSHCYSKYWLRKKNLPTPRPLIHGPTWFIKNFTPKIFRHFLPYRPTLTTNAQQSQQEKQRNRKIKFIEIGLKLLQLFCMQTDKTPYLRMILNMLH